MYFPKLLVLSCCAPCSCAAIKKLADDGIDATVLFYNPNIYPSAEYEKRRDEQKRVCEHFGLNFAELPYEPEKWDKAVAGLENEPERGKRCSACFYMRLERAEQYALEHKFTALTSVLGVSRYKDLDQVNEAARRAWYAVGKPYAAINWRKNGLEELRQALIKELQLYKQDYCGCKYSMRVKNDK
ncbi:epoxyqueuosine reductase QueH [Candidatus Avelusimicrobium fimicolum]|uniref:epoxyqueuosine reductase QueH n=1 Tax=Candidatus Avelusimicrobium fimicolum TaxID=3416216 RepID=UPI003D0AE1B9